MAMLGGGGEHAPWNGTTIVQDEQILPRIRWVPIGKSNCYLNEEKSQPSPIFKIAVDILKQTNFFRAFTASSTIPAIYIQQFWDTICFDRKTSGFERPRAPVLQILWGVVNRAHIDYAERMWEEFTQSIHNFTEDKRNRHLRQQATLKNQTKTKQAIKAYRSQAASKKPKQAPAKPQEKKRKPVSESSDAPPLAKRAKVGKVLEDTEEGFWKRETDMGTHFTYQSARNKERGKRSRVDEVNAFMVRSGLKSKAAGQRPW
ncbi:hypothetical protein Tco_1205508 [Tanacetum coccineum]